MIDLRTMACAGLLLGWSGLAAAQAPTSAVGNAQLDPSGQLGVPAQLQPLPLTPDEQNQLSTAHDGLREQALPEGGYALDLQGRFQNPIFATTTPQGQAHISHAVPGLAPEEHHHASH